MSGGKSISHKPSYNNPVSYNKLPNMERRTLIFCSLVLLHHFWFNRHGLLITGHSDLNLFWWTQHKGFGSYLIHNQSFMCVHVTLLDYEVELRSCQHEDSKQGREGSIQDRGKHVLQGQNRPLISVPYGSEEGLYGAVGS